MVIRCHHLGLIAGLALVLSVSASEWTTSVPEAAPGGQAVVEQVATAVSPVPSPVLFLAGGLLALAAMVRWRQHLRR